MDEVGIIDEVLDVAMQAFNLEVIAKHGKPVGILCVGGHRRSEKLQGVIVKKDLPGAAHYLIIEDGPHRVMRNRESVIGTEQ